MTVKSCLVWERTRSITRGALLLFAMSACGQSGDAASTSASSDTASAYAALSTSLDTCQAEQDACVTSAAGDAALIAECDAAAESCVDATKGMQDRARMGLRRDAEDCVRTCRRHRDDADGGVDEGARPGASGDAESTRNCMSRHVPTANTECRDTFFTCLDETGVRDSGSAMELDPATRDAVAACVDSAHSCMLGQMMGRHGSRDRRRTHPSADAGSNADAAVDMDTDMDMDMDTDRDRAGRSFGPRGSRSAAGASAPGRRWAASAGAAGN